MLTVFHIISHFDIGGAENVAISISKSDNKDIKYHIIEVAKGCSDYSQKMITELNNAHITIHRSTVCNTKIAILVFPFRLLSLIHEFHPDIIHTHTETPDLALFLTYKYFKSSFDKIGIVRTIHNTKLWNRWNKIGDIVEQFMKNKASIISISKSTQQSYHEKYGIYCPLIYNGVPEKAQRVFSKIKKNKINILFCGRMEYQKGCQVMIEVFSNFGDDDRFHFHVVGTGTMIEYVKSALCRFKNISFYNSIAELSSYLGSFDYLFMPSEFEGLALTPMEAALAHTPTIINSAPGLEEIFPENWCLKAEGNDISLYIKLFDNLENTSRESVGDQIYNHVKKNFSVERMRQQYEDLYYEICRKNT